MSNGDGSSQIELARSGLGKLLGNHYLVVPVNQRSYKWEKDHVNDLLQDLQNAITDNPEKDYFLGTIVLTKGEKGTLEVADGQQRLATTTILLAAIRDYLFRKGDKRHQQIQDTYLLKSDLITEELSPRLRLNVADNTFFRKRILSYPDSDDRVDSCVRPDKELIESHRNIAVASRLATEHVAKLDSLYGGEAIKRILQWVIYIDDHASVIMFIVPDKGDAFVIFETLNDRGLELSKADLLKNFLFGRAGTDRMKEVEHLWSAMSGALETVVDDDITVTYIRHLWISREGPTREKELYKRIKDKVKSKQAAVDLAQRLGSSARRYVALLNASHHEFWNTYSSKTRQHVSLIRMMGWKQVRPLMLAIIEEMKPKEVEKAFRVFVCWTVRFLIYGGLGSGSVEDSFADCAQQVTQKKMTTANEIGEKLLPTIPGDDEFRAAFAIARVSKPYLARYYLRAMGQQLERENEPELVPNEDPADVTLEHVMPQNLENGWKHIDRELHPSLVKRLGNLALLKRTPNSDEKSNEFEDKIGAYKISVYALTKELASYSKWGPEQIAERQAKMANIAVKTWPLAIR